jgi:hypothetical protein
MYSYYENFLICEMQGEAMKGIDHSCWVRRRVKYCILRSHGDAVPVKT